MTELKLLSDLKKGYELWANKDESAVPYFMELLSDDIKWSSLANGCEGAGFTKSRAGKPEVVGYFTELVGEWELVNYTADEFVAERDRIVMIGRCSFKNHATGSMVETPKVDIFRHDGLKITEFMEYYDTHQMVCAAQAS